jgi:putative transposase
VDEPQAKKAKKKVRKKEEPAKDSEDLLVRKIRILATAEQRTTLKRWMGAARWVYNRVVAHLQSGGAANKSTLRPLYVHNAAFSQDNSWMLDVPYDVRDGALEDALVAFKTGMKKKKSIRNFTFKLKFRSKKNPSESMYVCSRAFKKGTIYPQFGLGDLRFAEQLPRIEHDCRLQRTSLGQLFICIPFPFPQPPATVATPLPMLVGETQAQQQQQPQRQRVVALDPGVRTFLTGYDPSGALIEVGPGDVNRIARLCMHLDKLQSRCDKADNAKRRLRLRKAAMRMRTRIRDLVGDAHKKAACFLSEAFDLVLLPKFETSKMVMRAQRRIRSKTARMMLTWAHYRFRQTLTMRAKRSGTHVKLVDEAYTSKTCGVCGTINQKLGGAKVCRCPSCAHQVDRDANGARNILLRNADAIGLVVEGHLRMALSPGTSPM